MSDQIVITLPDDLYARARHLASSTGHSVEKVLLDHLRTLPSPAVPPDMQTELDALPHLSDDALLTLAGDILSDEIKTRVLMLTGKNGYGVLTTDETEELDRLMQRADRLMLRKSAAHAIIQMRKHLCAIAQRELKQQQEELSLITT